MTIRYHWPLINIRTIAYTLILVFFNPAYARNATQILSVLHVRDLWVLSCRPTIKTQTTKNQKSRHKKSLRNVFETSYVLFSSMHVVWECTELLKIAFAIVQMAFITYRLKLDSLRKFSHNS